MGFLGAAVIYACALIISFSASHAIDGEGSVTNETVVKQAFGLQSGKPYPLRFGKRIEGSGGEAVASAGFFLASAAVNVQPASALSVAFHHGSRSYILELPMSKIVFTKKQNSPETIRLSIGGSQPVSYYGLKFVGIFLPGGEKPLEKTGWFEDLKRNGQLGEFIAKRGVVESVKITLTPQDYQKILG